MGWNLNAKSMTIPEGSVKKITDSIGRIIWQASSGVTYTPILPDDTTAFPMYLNGWAKYTFTSVTKATSGSVYVQTGINGKTPSTCYCSDYIGEPSTTSSLNRADKRAQYRYTTSATSDWAYLKDSDVGTTVEEWNAYLSNHPIDLLFELAESDDSLWFAVTDSTNYGYYNPQSGEFVSAYGMTGTKIERVEYTSFDGTDCHINTGINLTGADTVIIDFLYKKSGSNIFGSWRSSNNDVYTLYASASKSYTRYGSSLYRNLPVPTDTRVTYKMTPTGNYLNNTSYDTWSQLTFDSATPCLVGWLSGSGSPHMSGCVYDFTIEGSSHLIPVKIGALYYMFDCLRWSLPEHHGTFDGGQVVDTPIEFPTSISERLSLFTMGGNPFSPGDDEESPEN